MKAAIDADSQSKRIIQELLTPWNITYTSAEESDVIIVYGKYPSESSRTIVIPSCSICFDRWVTDSKFSITRKRCQRFSVKATQRIALSISPEIVYEHNNSEERESFAILALDVVKEYKRILRETLCAKMSKRYSLFTTLPVSYDIMPKQFRDSFMKQGNANRDFDLSNFLPLDALRFELARKIEYLLKKKIARENWGSHNKCICALTHDVDTRDGLLKSTRVKKLEEKYNASSAWYIPSAQYPLEQTVIATLANGGEIGSHDTKHDGRLSFMSGRKLSARLSKSKQALEKMIRKQVVGFRAPLLQHTPDIISSLHDCGYQYDTSIPTWEAKHPRTMSSHGIGSLFPICISGIKELPITIMQDHQFLYVLGYKPKEVISAWLTGINMIKELGGSCILLVHPEYSILDSQGLALYEELLNSLAYDNEISIELPRQVYTINAEC